MCYMEFNLLKKSFNNGIDDSSIKIFNIESSDFLIKINGHSDTIQNIKLI